MAFDKHMNLVLGECEERRTVKSRKASGTSEWRASRMPGRTRWTAHTLTAPRS